MLKRVVLLGPPGGGKGTVAGLVKKARNEVSTISIGDLVRAEIRGKTPLGVQMEETVRQGGLVADSTVLGLFEKWLQAPQAPTSWILDGIPRTPVQAQGLDDMLQKLGKPLDLAVLVDVPTELLVERLSQRRVHAPSGRTYHLEFHPPRVANCDDVTGEPLTIREDDRPEVIRARISTYKTNLQPILSHYASTHRLLTVEAPSSPIAFRRFMQYFPSTSPS